MSVRQIVKSVIYSLLLLNFFQYVANDIDVASHTAHSGWTPVDWARAFATTLDEAAWFLLLFLLELETYLLSDEAFTRTRVLVMHGLRLACYLFIGHTVFAYSDTLLDLSRAVAHSGTSLCSFANEGVSFTRNLEYRDLDGSNCRFLSSGAVFYQFAQGQAITDGAGMRVEWGLAWADLIEVVVWLLILLLIEAIVRLQEKGVTSGKALRYARRSKMLLYAILWAIAGYWAYLGHWMFAWDEALWILGFVAIGMNLSQWRDEIDAGNAQSSAGESAA